MADAHDAQEWYFSHQPGTVSGPVSLRTLEAMLSAGQLKPTDQARHQQWSRWYPLSSVAGRYAPAAPAVTPPAAPPAAQQAPPVAATRMPTAPPPAGAQWAPPTPGPAPVAAVAANPAAPTSHPVAAVPLGTRSISWLVDIGVLIGALALLNAVASSTVATLFAFAVTILYLVVLPAKGIDTVGHALTGITVVSSRPDVPLTALALATRTAVILLLSAPLLIGMVCSLISMSAHPKALAWHDVASGTTVMRSTGPRLRRAPVPWTGHSPAAAADKG